MKLGTTCRNENGLRVTWIIRYDSALTVQLRRSDIW